MKIRVDDILYRIKDKYYCVREFIVSVQRVIRWIPVIWKIHDCDWSSIIYVLRYQLQRVHRHLEHGYALHKGKNLRGLETAIHLLDRIQRDTYFENYVVRAREVGEEDMLNKESYWISRQNPKLLSDQEFMSYMLKSNEQRKNDFLYLGKVFSQYLITWWD